MSGLGYRICPVTPFVQNCSLIWCETTRQAAFVDPGGEVDRLLGILEKADLTLEKIILTHAQPSLLLPQRDLDDRESG